MSRGGTSTTIPNGPVLLQLLKGILTKVTCSVVEKFRSWRDEAARLIGWSNIRIPERWKQRWGDGLDVVFATIRGSDQSGREPQVVRLEGSESQVIEAEEEILTTRDWEFDTFF